uniref:Rhomboid-related protein 4 n=1 Tax=Cacopsylla melanoneura TaxID=428564 RepID=A0A8D8TFN2_9HEMI
MPRRCFRHELGIMLLLYQIFSLGIDLIPPGTLGLILLQTLVYLNIFPKPWDTLGVCISAHTILYDREYRRLVLSALEHGDDMHLYYNMVSLIVKGKQLERMFGIIHYLVLVFFLIVSTSAMYVLLSVISSMINNDESDLYQCAIGFSAVLFAMKTIMTRLHPNETQQLLNMTVRAVYAPWIELIVIHLMVPNASFKGHLSGILVGLCYTETPLRILVHVGGHVVSEILGSEDEEQRTNNVNRR